MCSLEWKRKNEKEKEANNLLIRVLLLSRLKYTIFVGRKLDECCNFEMRITLYGANMTKDVI